MAELEADNDERPLEPPFIKKTEILNNPFDDIYPRELERKPEEKKKEKKKSQMKATKNFKLLSFGDEAEEDEEEVQQASTKMGKIASAHDQSNDPSLSTELALSEKQLEEDRTKIKTQAVEIRNKLKKELEIKPTFVSGSVRQEKLDKLKLESEKLLNDIKGIGKEEKLEAKKEAEKDEHLNVEEKETLNKFRKDLKDFKLKQSEKKQPTKPERERHTMSVLAEFKAKLKKSAAQSDESTQLTEEVVGEDEEDLLNSINLFSHSIVDADRTAKVKDASRVDDDTFEIIDPRHPINKRKREKKNKGGAGAGGKPEDDKWKRTKLLT